MHTNSTATSTAGPQFSYMDKQQNNLVRNEIMDDAAKLNGEREHLLAAGNMRKSKSNDDDDEVEDEEQEEDGDDEDDDDDDDEEEEEESGSPMGYNETDAANDGPSGLNEIHNGEVSMNHEDGEEEKVLLPARELATIKSSLQFLNHQMSLLTKALNVKPCICADCDMVQKMQQNAILNPSRSSSSMQHSHQNTSIQQNGMSMENGFKIKLENADNNHKILTSPHQPTPTSALKIGIGESTQRGRRSKYCTHSEKKEVASYVQIHGATAAARKFNIPPAVAAYYHRREFKNKQSAGGRRFMLGSATPNQLLQAAMKGGGGDSSGEGGTETGITDENKAASLAAQFWQGSAGGQQHAYLRGRGRGRPKLIGDELDAELVEHIVSLKQQTRNAHLTASYALDIARNYIVQKAPGLLEENGGQVKLKITWAMKLVNRVQEREREIQLGLPPGTLQNLPRSLNQSGDQSSALMDELLGQNLLNQNVNALLAAATNSAVNDDVQQGAGTSATDNAAMLNAMLGVAAGGNASEMFGMAEQQSQQPGTSRTQQQMNLNMETNSEEQDAAIRQLLASLHGGGRSEHQEATEMDVAAALAQMSG